jgi:hypothetical protein
MTDLNQPWQTSDCFGSKGFGRETICEREPPGSRAAAGVGALTLSTAVTQDRKRYLLLPSLEGADDAAQACEKIGGGARLVLLESREEREELAAELARAGNDGGVWIALATDANGAWRWDEDPTDSGLPPGDLWGNGAPGEQGDSSTPQRAYLAISPGTVDSELAHAGATTAPEAGAPEMHYALCQIPSGATTSSASR